ncbi:FkbM family methyltransferase [Mycobacterium sp.]|uniref:FkbM family methyltransferase n=1 Tax=Mycobacterium sp. TaxID=1785 RepID=UPI002B8020F2|nr:FkbM family methyltransferase [Mycobacterium sp.]HTQ18672.1 FkbM family methyltransferase [Mycobacterium sp.]
MVYDLLSESQPPNHVLDLLSPSRLTHVVDIGANRLGGHFRPPYLRMLKAGLCHVTGFEPQRSAFLELQRIRGPNELYLPHAVGDGNQHTLKVCRASGMTSLLEPDPITLGLLDAENSAEVLERVPLETRRLDDISEIEHLDFLKIDIQGSELSVFQNGHNKLAKAVAIQTEVSFINWYQNQPSFGEIDVELRGQGFIPHYFTELKVWNIGGHPGERARQVLEADFVYVRDFFRVDMNDEQLKHLALVAHYCYGSFDLAARCVSLLEERQALDAGSKERYIKLCPSE